MSITASQAGMQSIDPGTWARATPRRCASGTSDGGDLLLDVHAPRLEGKDNHATPLEEISWRLSGESRSNVRLN